MADLTLADVVADTRPWDELSKDEQRAAWAAMEAAGFPFDVYPGGPDHPDAPEVIVEIMSEDGVWRRAEPHDPAEHVRRKFAEMRDADA